jgi:hypothetical protein
MRKKIHPASFSAILSVAVFALGALTPSAQAACPGGGCSGSFSTGPVKATFKGSSSKLAVVTTVDGGNMTISNNKKYLIGDAKITVDGKPSDLASIKPGMSVLVNGKAVAGEKDLYRASRVNARSPK